MADAHRLPGHLVGCNLRAGYYGPGSHVPCNLGTGGDGPDPPDPPPPPWRGLRVGAGVRWRRPARAPVRIATGLGWQQGRPLAVAAGMRWQVQQQAAARAGWGIAWQQAARLALAPVAVRWGQSRADARLAAGIAWRFPPIVRISTGVRWGQGEPVSISAGVCWLYPPQHRISTGVRWGEGEPVSISAGVHWLYPPQHRPQWDIRWGEGAGLPWIVRPPAPPPAPPVPVGRIDGRYIGADLGCPIWTGPASHIPARLGTIACFNVRPRRKVYVVKNEITVVRLPDRLPIQVLGGSIKLDAGSWGHSFTLQLATAEAAIALRRGSGGPREIEISLNGHAPITGIVESRTTDRSFAQHRWTVAGRARTALLAEPWAPRRTRTVDTLRTAAQLVDDELADTGFTATWDTVDWNIPPGVWSYADLTPMEAITRIAAAVGAVVQSDLTGKHLHIKPRYPVRPWDWTNTPVTLALVADVALSVSDDHRDLPLYDEVFVSGVSQGVQGFHRRTGEGGGTYAAQHVHPLITDAIAHAEAGSNILADRGRQEDWTFSRMPLFPVPLLPGQVGLVQPLELREVAEGGSMWVGMVTSNAINFGPTPDGKGQLIHQTATVVRHPEDAN